MRLHQGPVTEIASMAVFIKPRHYRGATRHADGGGVVVIIKSHTISRQTIDVWRLHVLVAVTTQRVAALVIRKEENYVGTRRLAEHNS